MGGLDLAAKLALSPCSFIWPRTGVSNTNLFNRQWSHDVTVAFELVNEQGRVIGRNSKRNALNYLRVENGVVRGFSSSSPQTTLRFPVEIWGETDYGIIAIGNGAFENKQLSIIEIPDSVTFIGDRTFYGNKITNIVIPNSVNIVGREAFVNNSYLSDSNYYVVLSPIRVVTICSRVRVRVYAFGDGFEEYYYNKFNRRAGTYTKNSAIAGRWEFEEQK